MPADTHFQLWAGATPETVFETDLAAAWRAEVRHWGGEDAFQEHWMRCRKLPHEFVRCDLLEDAQPLFERIAPEKSAAIWWSNAFFTLYGNWHYSIAERRRR